MKVQIGLLVLMISLSSCQESETVSEFTGNEAIYALQQASDYEVNGTVTLKEKKDGSTIVLIELSGTDGNIKLPAHLHFGDLSTPGAEIAAMLEPVFGATGISETHLEQLANETKVTFKELIEMEACIKVHLSDIGPEKDIVLVGGNIGSIATVGAIGGRVGIGVCKSD